jgi:hypothetical protein
MHSTQLFCVIFMSFWPAVAAGSQTTDAGPLSKALRTHLQSERFQIVTSIRGLPLGVRDALQMLFGSQTLDIAEPGAEFQSTGTGANAKLPIRRLVSAGCSMDHCLVYYERSGTDHTWRVTVFHWTPEATRFEGGGVAPAGLATVDDVRKALLSEGIKSPARVW